MNRRDFIGGSTSMGVLAGGTFGGPHTARAQRQNLPLIGLLDGVWGHLVADASRALAENGCIESRDFRFEHSGWHGAEYQADRIAKYAAKLVERQAAVILAFSNKAALAAKSVTSTTPVIFLADHPLAAGLVDNMRRPGGNLTGVAGPDSGLIRKRIETIRELAPTTNLVLVTDPTDTSTHDLEIREAQAAAKTLGLELSFAAWTGEHSIELALAALPHDRKALLIFGDGLPFFVEGAILAYLAMHYEIPAIHGDRETVEKGGLASFGTRFADGGYLMGAYAARILKREMPAGLPVRQIMRTELVINPRTAKSLGLQIPATLLARANEVID